MGGNDDSDSWKAYVASLLPLPATPSPPPPPQAEPTKESPLGPRLKRKADRYGDSVPYGKHGTWGMYREGTKEMSSKIAKGVISPADASAALAAEGVSIAARVLKRKAQEAPGESPSKTGTGVLLSFDTESAVHAEVAEIRKHDLPVTKVMVKSMANSRIRNTPEEALFSKDGVTDKWYYSFLNRFDMNTDDTKPLETDRDLWLTSKVPKARIRACASLMPPAANLVLLPAALVEC